MSRRSIVSFAISGLALLLLVFCISPAMANVWIDEDFDDGVAFNAEDIDTYSANPLANPLNVSHSGAVTNVRAFNGTHSYVMTGGQGIAIIPPYQDQANGEFQYIQFAASLGSIPAAGTMATLRWNWDMNGTDYSFYLNFVSDGSKVDLYAGEDQAGANPAALVDSIPDTNTWKYLTLQLQKNQGNANDDRVGQTGVSQGLRFYSSSLTPAVTLLLPNESSNNTAKDWILDVTSGSLYIDNLYWEGGMTGAVENSSLRNFETGQIITNVQDWQLY